MIPSRNQTLLLNTRKVDRTQQSDALHNGHWLLLKTVTVLQNTRAFLESHSGKDRRRGNKWFVVTGGRGKEKTLGEASEYWSGVQTQRANITLLVVTNGFPGQ